MPTISDDCMPTREECEQIWSAASDAFHRAMPEGPVPSKGWTPEQTTRMRLSAGYAAWEKVTEILTKWKKGDVHDDKPDNDSPRPATSPIHD